MILSFFVHQWWASRDRRSLLRATGAIVIAAVLLALVVKSAATNRLTTAANYKTQFEVAFEDNDLPTASLCFRRLQQMDHLSELHQYLMALLLARHGESQQASQMLHELAPTDVRGFALAHFKLGTGLLRKPKLSRTDLALAQWHLSQAVDRLPNPQLNVEAHQLLGRSWELLGANEKAIAEYRQCVEASPRLLVKIAWLFRRMRQFDSALAAGQQAETYYSKRLEADPDDVEAQLWHAQSLVVLARISDAVQEIIQLLKRTGDPKYRVAAADLLVTAADIVMTQQTPNRKLATDLLWQAIRANSENLIAHQKLVGLAKLDDQLDEEAQKLVEKLVKDERPSSAARHLLLGTVATQQGQLEWAKSHFKQAYKLDPTNPTIINNLAWVLAELDEDLPHALELIEQALLLVPNRVAYRETRGQILAKLQRWESALVDLQLAVKAMPNEKAVHSTLARVYEELGRPEDAARHRSLATEDDSKNK